MSLQRSTVALPMVAIVVLCSAATLFAQDKKKVPANQYEFESIVVSPASADEPVRSTMSLKASLDYIEQGAIAWSKARKCVSCHTNGTYLAIRPSLTPQLGKPNKAIRSFFVESLEKLKATKRERLKSGFRPTQVTYVAAGLAEWDAHVTGKLSTETSEALRLMFELQSEDGSFLNANCWPPYESSSYHAATVAAMAAATAPGWLESVKDKKITAAIDKLRKYLWETTPSHDYGRLLLLWTATRFDGLIDKQQKADLIEMVWKHQQKDGGWSVRTFAAPEAWGSGNRAAKLKAEPKFKNPLSDGHQTGLAVMVLRDAGVRADDPRIQRAVKWLLSNQRESGRWWTRSLNTDRYHFITYSGTLFPLAALAKCDALPPLDDNTAGK